MEPNTEQSLFDSNMDQVSQDHLQTFVKWTRFITITAFIGLGLLIMVLALAGTQFTGKLKETFEMNYFGAMAGLFIVVILLIIAFTVAWIYFLYQASAKVSEGLRTRDSGLIADGFASLKIYFIISVVISALSLVYTLGTRF